MRFKKPILPCHPEGGARRISKNIAQEILHFAQNDMALKMCTDLCHPEDKVRRILNKKDRKCAFTLAEVLITLGIIGIVAAMTFPTVIQNSKRQEASARLKKFVSAMEQAIMLSEIDNGSATEWSKQNVIRDENGDVDAAKSNAEVNRYYNLYLKKYLKTITILEEDPESSDRMKVYFADSSSMTLYNGTCLDILFDYNGDSKPNVSGRDRFKFLLCPAPYNERYHKNKKNFGTYDQKYINSREDALQKCKEAASYCTNLLEYDNWEFKDDYPYKL